MYNKLYGFLGKYSLFKTVRLAIKKRVYYLEDFYYQYLKVLFLIGLWNLIECNH